MATQEIYLRNATETEARGPFNPLQVGDLAEAGQVTPDTLIYDATTEQWVALSSQAELMAAVFPERKKLTLKAKEINALNKPTDSTKPISVDDMVAAAEGLTPDTAGKRSPAGDMARAARFGLWGATLALVLAAAGEILPGAAALMSAELSQWLEHPFAVVGAIDLVLAVLLGLGMTTLYPVVRFRAALGFGLMGTMLYLQGDNAALLPLVTGSLGLYLCTVFVHLVPALVAALAAVAGWGLLSWHFISP
ncbi:MAG: GYF domain-containing protein [Opitutaceae bacterium]